MNTPDNLRYTPDHTWLLIKGDIVTIGITDHAQEELNNVVFVDLPDDRHTCIAGDSVATVKSVIAVRHIYSPIAGEIIAINTDLEVDPSLVNTAPYTSGWIFKLRLGGEASIESLIDAAAYHNYIA